MIAPAASTGLTVSPGFLQLEAKGAAGEWAFLWVPTDKPQGVAHVTRTIHFAAQGPGRVHAWTVPFSLAGSLPDIPPGSAPAGSWNFFPWQTMHAGDHAVFLNVSEAGSRYESTVGGWRGAGLLVAADAPWTIKASMVFDAEADFDASHSTFVRGTNATFVDLQSQSQGAGGANLEVLQTTTDVGPGWSHFHMLRTPDGPVAPQQYAAEHHTVTMPGGTTSILPAGWANGDDDSGGCTQMVDFVSEAHDGGTVSIDIERAEVGRHLSAVLAFLPFPPSAVPPGMIGQVGCDPVG